MFWIGAAIAGLGAWIILGNFWLIARWMLGAKPESTIPLIGGVLMALGLKITAVPAIQYWWWVPLVIDPGGIFVNMVAGVLLCFFWLARRL